MKSYIIKFVIILTAVLSFVFNFTNAFADDLPSFHKIVFFGDSLSDRGNLYHADYNYLPKSPPYYQGRFSNGQVWSELTAAYYADSNKIPSANFAYGGETAIFHSPIHGYLPYSLTASIDAYLVGTIFHDRSQTLYFVWIGANDYLKGAKDPNAMTDKVVANIKGSIEKLAYHGGANFIVINLPDLGRTPYAQTTDAQALSTLTQMHNAKLAAAVTEIQQDYPSIHIKLFDMNKVFSDFVNDPAQFDKEHNINVTDVQDACWGGGYTTRSTALDNQSTTQQIATDLQLHINNNPQKVVVDASQNQNLDVDGFANYIASTPALMETYKVGDGELHPCSNPDQYMFWDHLHPTAVVHGAISKLMIDFINQNYIAK